jgi:hypothetical protein
MHEVRTDMRPDRKKKLKKRQEREVKNKASKLEIIDRLLKLMGLESVFRRLPSGSIDNFVNELGPKTEVIASVDSQADPEIKYAVHAITSLIKRPVKSAYLHREFELAYDDVFRGYYSIINGVEYFYEEFQQSDDRALRRFCYLWQEAKEIIGRIDDEWMMGVLGELTWSILDVINRNFRLDGRMIDAKLSFDEKSHRRQIVLRLIEAQPKDVFYQGSRWTTYQCYQPNALNGLTPISWNCARLGIEGPNVDLPVLIEKHAIARLHERLPLRGAESILHRMMAYSLGQPVFIAQGPQKYLVEACLGKHKVGYLVALILPHMILIKTFLFLTMQGTPEAERLRDKLGLSRADVEHYKLDQFHTLIGSDIVKDPLLVKVLSECGCGHLISLIEPTNRLEWVEAFGQSLKSKFDIREARQGFMVGPKWLRWSDQGQATQRAN